MHLLFNTTGLIEWGGVALILLLIFAETGLLIGLAIPGGETLIFSSGLFVSTGVLSIDIALFLPLMIAAAFAGDSTAYAFGKKLGPRLYRKQDTWYFKKRFLSAAHDYIERHRRLSLIIGKFMPIVRPFVPLISGVGKLKLSVFLPLSLLSVALYVSVFLLLGYFLGNQFPSLQNYLGWILPISVGILLIPVIIQFRKHRNGNRRPA